MLCDADWETLSTDELRIVLKQLEAREKDLEDEARIRIRGLSNDVTHTSTQKIDEQFLGHLEDEMDSVFAELKKVEEKLHALTAIDEMSARSFVTGFSTSKDILKKLHLLDEEFTRLTERVDIVSRKKMEAEQQFIAEKSGVELRSEELLHGFTELLDRLPAQSEDVLSRMEQELLSLLDSKTASCAKLHDKLDVMKREYNAVINSTAALREENCVLSQSIDAHKMELASLQEQCSLEKVTAQKNADELNEILLQISNCGKNLALEREAKELRTKQLADNKEALDSAMNEEKLLRDQLNQLREQSVLLLKEEKKKPVGSAVQIIEELKQLPFGSDTFVEEYTRKVESLPNFSEWSQITLADLDKKLSELTAQSDKLEADKVALSEKRDQLHMSVRNKAEQLSLVSREEETAVLKLRDEEALVKAEEEQTQFALDRIDEELQKALINLRIAEDRFSSAQSTLKSMEEEDGQAGGNATFFTQRAPSDSEIPLPPAPKKNFGNTKIAQTQPVKSPSLDFNGEDLGHRSLQMPPGVQLLNPAAVGLNGDVKECVLDSSMSSAGSPVGSLRSLAGIELMFPDAEEDPAPNDVNNSVTQLVHGTRGEEKAGTVMLADDSITTEFTDGDDGDFFDPFEDCQEQSQPMSAIHCSSTVASPIEEESRMSSSPRSGTRKNLDTVDMERFPRSMFLNTDPTSATRDPTGTQIDRPRSESDADSASHRAVAPDRPDDRNVIDLDDTVYTENNNDEFDSTLHAEDIDF